MIEKYRKITVHTEINKKINTLNTTRDNRIEMSKRLRKYSSHWKTTFFFLNIEAVMFILLSLGVDPTNEVFGTVMFNVFTGVFSIYVMLLQYYINGLNYDERALRLHYHQLDIEDLVLKLKNIILENNIPNNRQDEKVLIENFSSIMFKYQSILKNNENHDSIDYLNAQMKGETSGNLGTKIKIKKISDEKKKEYTNIKVGKGRQTPLYDFTIDNIFLSMNKIIILVPLVLYLILLYVR